MIVIVVVVVVVGEMMILIRVHVPSRRKALCPGSEASRLIWDVRLRGARRTCQALGLRASRFHGVR